MLKEYALTTNDNPFNPFTQFDSWFAFDIEKGYYTCSRIARLTNLTDDMSEVEKSKEIERAIDKLIEIDVLDIYKKVEREKVDETV